MSDTDWGDEGAPPAPKKKRIPTWAWWTCGSGCLVATLVAIALAVLVTGLAKEFGDTERAWESVREILPYDTRPQGWEARGVTVFGMGNYFLDPPQPGAAMLVQSLRGRPEFEALFDPDSAENGGPLAFTRLRDPVLGTLELQGREVRCLSFRGGMPGEPDAREGYGIRIDLARTERPALVQLSLARAEAPLTAEQVGELLAPFDVWRGR